MGGSVLETAVIIDSTVEPILPLCRAVGKIPSGLFVITTGMGPHSTAMLVSFVQQLSREPICIGVALHRNREVSAIIERTGGFVLNICHAGDKNLLRKYARQSLTGDAAFEGMRTHRLGNGGTILLDACAWIWCDLHQRIDFKTDHELIIGTATEGGLSDDDKAKPVVHIRHDGSNY